MRVRRLQEALAYFGWKKEKAGRFDTPEGVADLTREGTASMKPLLAQAWNRQLFRRDKRCADPRSQRQLADCDPRCGTQRTMQSGAQGTFTTSCKAAVGAAPDFRTHSKEWPECTCRCGAANPTRRHMAWECEATAAALSKFREPSCGAEERLMVKLTKRWRRENPADYTDKANVDKVARAIGSAQQIQGKVLVATDGGVVGRIPNERAAVWGVAVGGRRVTGGLVPGWDTSTRAAEHRAAIMAPCGAASAKQDIWLLIDNSAVVLQTAGAARGNLPPPRRTLRPRGKRRRRHARAASTK